MNISNKNTKKVVSNRYISLSREQVESFIKLFKMLPQHGMTERFHPMDEIANYGLIFVDVNGKMMLNVGDIGSKAARAFYGTETRLFNETFYKSFATVRDADPMTLLFDQILHYMTTYGAEAAGIKIPTYVPVQALNIPKNSIKNGFKFTVICEATIDACIERLNDYLKSLTAPSEEIKRYLMPILGLTTVKTDDIKSFEIQVIKHKMDGTVPQSPVNQLRYLVYMTTNETLLIKNKYLRQSIQNANTGDLAYNILSKCDMTGLASIFLRYKPIFLAFKQHNKCAPIINYLRRLADTYHKPLTDESLQNFTSLTSKEARDRVLKKATNRDLIKLLDAMYARCGIDETMPGVYAIRNGRTFVKEDGLKPGTKETHHIADYVLDVLLSRIGDSLKNKVYYLPEYVEYVVPTTEKQFIGNIPYGSSISIVPESAFTAGVHWFNQKDDRVDIDLHLNSATQHLGWNAMYRDGSEIIYTGDQTNAPMPHGGAEAFWFEPKGETYVLSVNLFSGPDQTEFKLFMTNVKPNGEDCQRRNYTFNPNESLFPAIPLKFDKGSHDMNIGVFCKNSFYFYGGKLSNGIVPTANYKQFIDGFTAQITSKCNLRTLLELAGAKVITSLEGITPEMAPLITSLAPEDLTVDTLFDIIDCK